MIIEYRSIVGGVSQLLTISPVKGLRNSTANTKVKQTTENGDGLVVDNGPPDVEDLGVANTDQSDTGSVPTEMQSSA